MSNTSLPEHPNEFTFENEEEEEEDEEDEDEREEEEDKAESKDIESVDDVEIEEGEEKKTVRIRIIKKARCEKRKKISQVCYGDKNEREGVSLFFYDEEEEENEYEYSEEEELEGEYEEEDESEKSDDFSLLSAIIFEWDNETYEFDELCVPGHTETVYKRYYSESELNDEIGVVRYLHACNRLLITPTLRLLREFETKEIDLGFCNVNSKNIRAMCFALEANAFVERLILKYNKLTPEDCFHIGRMLRYNDKIAFVDFTGCKIGPKGTENLIENLPKNDSVTHLNLSKCNIQDEGMVFFAQYIMRNNSIIYLDLSYNNLGDGSAESLGMALKLNTKLTDLNLRYNNFFNVPALREFFRGLIANSSITTLNLSWNGMSGKETGNFIGNLLKRNSTVTHLDISDNRLEGTAVVEIKKGLSRSKSLITLKIGTNPIPAESLDILLAGAKNCSTLQLLDLEHLWVNKSFVKALKRIQQDKDFNVNYEGVFGNYEIYGPDYPKILLQRAQYEAMKPKKIQRRKDFGHLVLGLDDEPMTEEDFMNKVKKFKAKVNSELYPELINEFYDPKLKMIDVAAMKKKYLSLFPNSEPPPPQKERQKKKGGKGKEEKEEEKSKKSDEKPPVAKAKEKPTIPKAEEKRSNIYAASEMSEDEEEEYILGIESEEDDVEGLFSEEEEESEGEET